MTAGGLADVDDPHAGGQPFDDGARGEPVDHHDVGRREQLAGPRGQQPVGPRPAADEGDPAGPARAR